MRHFNNLIYKEDIMAVSIESKVLTDNPLLDEIIYNCRQLCAQTVLKDQDEADKYETLESIQNGDILIDIAQGHINFGRFYYKLHNAQRSVICTGETYDTVDGVVSAIESVRRFAAYAEINN